MTAGSATSLRGKQHPAERSTLGLPVASCFLGNKSMNEGADDIHSQVRSDAAPRDRLLTAWCESRGQVPSIANWNRL
jgi:hypothetical protein